MRYLRAWLLGSIAASILAGAAIATLSAAAASGAVSDLRVAVWGIVLVSVESDAGTSETTIGPALALLALVGGLLNATLLGLLTCRGRRRGAKGSMIGR